MKKGLIVGISFLFILIVLMSFASAGLFSNFWAKITGKQGAKITGKYIYAETCLECIDYGGKWCDEGSGYGFCADSSDSYAYCLGSWFEYDCPCPTSCDEVPECFGWECGDCYEIPYDCYDYGFLNCGNCDTSAGYVCDEVTHTCEMDCASDETEVYRIVDPAGSETCYSTDDSDKACCNTYSGCVAHGICYNSDTTYTNSLCQSTGSSEYCYQGIWYNEKSSVSESICRDTFDWHYLGRNIDDSLSSSYIDASDRACCSTDTQCVANGYCYKSAIVHTSPGGIMGEEYCLDNVWYDNSNYAGCSSDAECDDFECQIASCTAGTCSYSNEVDETPCTSVAGGECSSGTCVEPSFCGDGIVDSPDEECDDGASNSDTEVDACRTDCKLPYCGDGICDPLDTCESCPHDCNNCWEGLDCVDCLEGFNWCVDTQECINSPLDEECDIYLEGTADEEYCPAPCVATSYNNYDREIPDNYKARFKEILSKQCDRTFSFTPITEGFLFAEGKQFEIGNRHVIETLDIISNLEDEGALLTLAINKDEISFPDDAFFYTWNKSTNSWEELEYIISSITSTTSYFYQIYPTHFSLFLIAELDYDYCGNEFFDVGYEVCDESVPGTTNCTDCECDSGFEENLEGNCTEIIEDNGCSEKGKEYCGGTTLYVCDDDLLWERKGKVIGDCGVECSPIGDNSCQGEIPVRCGTDYKWANQSKVSGLCGYTTTLLGYNGSTANRCGDGYCNYDEDEFSCPEDCTGDEPNKWMLPLIIAVVSLLILLIIIVLFKIYNKEKNRGQQPPAPRRNLPPEHRPGPKRAPGRPQEVRTGQIGRPPARKVSPGGYAVRKYPPRQPPR